MSGRNSAGAALELRVPPLLLVVLFAGGMWLASAALPDTPVPGSLRGMALATLLGSGVFFSVAGVAAFRRSKTTVNPTTPGAASTLVATGIYERSRNPMYVGFLFLLLAWGCALSSLWCLVLGAGFVLYMNRFQILPEERVLESVFGAEFVEYKQRVRRWL